MKTNADHQNQSGLTIKVVKSKIKTIADDFTAKDFYRKPLTYIAAHGTTIKFRRSKVGSDWVLQDIRLDLVEILYLGLFRAGARYKQDCRYWIKGKEFIAVEFTCPPALAAKLALNFPCPQGCPPLTIGGTPNKPVLIFGKAAERAKLAKKQKVAN